jgi:hypothetical protein
MLRPQILDAWYEAKLGLPSRSRTCDLRLRRPLLYPAELWADIGWVYIISIEQIEKMVGVQGFEPWTPCSQSRRATRLRYTPTEATFYTDRGISGKSCKIRAMVAYFPSKLIKHIKTALAVILLWSCVIGSQWFGYAHSISHSNNQQHSTAQTSSADAIAVFNHGSDVCHLFDALSLAGFIPETNTDVPTGSAASELPSKNSSALIPQTELLAYQPHAPPIPLP